MKRTKAKSKRAPSKAAQNTRKKKSLVSKAKGNYLSVALDAGKGTKQRISAIARTAGAAGGDPKSIQGMLDILRNKDEAINVRLAALESLGAASFRVIAFEPWRNSYIAALREVATDPNYEMRQRVLGILARQKDGFAQQKLTEGLKDPKQALLPPEKALQLLSYDVHAEAYPAARAIVENPPNPIAKREALRLLAADTQSAPIFEKVLRDKGEISENRQISAAALQAIDPEKLRKNAREILMDPKDYKEIQAASLTALTQFGDKTVGEDPALLKRVSSLKDQAPTMLKQSARRFLGRYSREDETA